MCDFPAGRLLMSFPFYLITISCVMIMMMIMMIIIVMFLQQICGMLGGFRGYVSGTIIRFGFLFIPGQGAQAVSICPSDCNI